MNRREFIIRVGTGLIAGSMVLSFASCGNDNGDSGTPAEGFEVDSTTNFLHSHSVRIINSDLVNPPANGVIYTSSVSLEHTHNIILTQQELSEINNGATVNFTSSLNDGHTHDWAIKKP